MKIFFNLRMNLLKKRLERLIKRTEQTIKKMEQLDPDLKKANEEATKDAWQRFEKRMIDEGIFE